MKTLIFIFFTLFANASPTPQRQETLPSADQSHPKNTGQSAPDTHGGIQSSSWPGTTNVDQKYRWIEGGTIAFDKAFPPSSWVQFETNFNNNKDKMEGNSANDIGLLNAITSSEVRRTGVDPRYLLAIIMQESHGNIRVGSTTAPDHSISAGVMQCDGSPSAHGIKNPSQTLVTGMVLCGAKHFKGNLQSQGGNVFEAFRMYNSGGINRANLNDPRGATKNYVNDCANRLHGWKN